MELQPVEYQVWLGASGYEIWRDGVKYDVIPRELVPGSPSDDVLLDRYLSGEFAYLTNNLPPEGVQVV